MFMLGQQLSQVYNLHRGKSEKPLQAEDFYPDFNAAVIEQTPEDHLRIVGLWNGFDDTE